MEDLSVYSTYTIKTDCALITEDGYLYGPVVVRVADIFDDLGQRTGLLVTPQYRIAHSFYIHTDTAGEIAIPKATFLIPENEC